MTEWTVNNKLNDWYQKRYHIKLPKEFVTKSEIYFGGSSFSPASLFSTTAIGIWLDPSDLTTMFSDRAGTTPVTTPGTVVGLRLDKSKGLVLGSELDDGGLATLANWTVFGTNVVAQDGDAIKITFTTGQSPSGAYQQLRQTKGLTTDLTVGKWYKFTGQAKVNSGSANVQILTASSWTSAAITSTSFTDFTIYFLCDNANTNYIAASNLSTGEEIWFRALSVRELAGNHAVAPTDAARPIYGVEPKGGRRNLLLATDTLATQSLTVAAVAHTLAFTGTGTVTLSGASTAGPLVGTGAGNRVTMTFTPTAASLTLTVSGSVTLGQLERASSATAYQRVTTDYDVTEAGVQTCHYCRYDGANSSMSTSAIDFTGTDKASVFAGLRKLSTTGSYNAFVELSATPSINGTFWVGAPNTIAPAQGYSLESKGSVISGAFVNSGFAPPISNVIAGISDISGDTVTLRVNGVQAAQSTTDQGTGNYGNYPLFIGRRGGTTFPFNGRDYGLIVVGKAASAGEITDTETWLAAKTSGVTI